MPTYPSAEESLARLHAAGWTVGEVRAGSSWLVTGANGKNATGAEGATSAEACWWAVHQAETVGMAGYRVHSDDPGSFHKRFP
jgi:hypothetical protein